MALLKETSVVFLSGVRTGFGSFGGTLKDLSATDLGASRRRAALTGPGSIRRVDHVVFGNVLQTSADAAYLARHSASRPASRRAPALTVNRLCGSGFEAVIQAGQQILLGSRGGAGRWHRVDEPGAPRGARRPWGLRFGPAPPLEDTLWEALRDANCGLSMAETAERLAEQYHISREAVDCFAALSQTGAKAAWDAGVSTTKWCRSRYRTARPGQTEPWAADEHMRPGTTPRRWPSCRRISGRMAW